jgi:hypothetical protein
MRRPADESGVVNLDSYDDELTVTAGVQKQTYVGPFRVVILEFALEGNSCHKIPCLCKSLELELPL